MLTLHNTRYIFGTIILVTHFSGMALYTALAAEYIRDKGFLETFGGVATLAPLTILYASAFYNFVVANPTVSAVEKRKPIDFGPFAVQLGVILLFSATLLGSIYYFFQNEHLIGGVGDYEVIQSVVALLESIFAFFLGATFQALFPTQWKKEDSVMPTSAGPPLSTSGSQRGKSVEQG